MRPALLCLACSLAFCLSLRAQDPNATVSGRVLDPSGAVVPGTQVRVINDATNIEYSTVTNDAGIYSIPSVPPGKFHIQISKNGFKNMVKPDVILHVQDALTINFTLEIGAGSESVTVEGGAPLVNTVSGSVGTVIDRHFVENLPLNGRSFNTLLQLTPGVVIAPTGTFSPGQFSINGQRTNANTFFVDGVSANFGAPLNETPGQYGSGGNQAFNVLGGTSSLVSVDAMQEFRVETSSFSPEFGRTPGGQIAIATRAGTNDFHGTAFDYFRNNVLDANDWFANAAGLPRAEERQNDFGGVLGGPIVRDRAFFFLSYEGFRLRQPNTVTSPVPTLATRTAAASSAPAIAALLNAFPVPAPNAPVLPDGETTAFAGSFSDPITSDSVSLRVDYNPKPTVGLFGRFNYAPSNSISHQQPISNLNHTELDTTTFTFGSNIQFSPTILTSIRFNFSRQEATSSSDFTAIDGAVPFSNDLALPSPLTAQNSLAFITLSPTLPTILDGTAAARQNSQVNIVGDTTFVKGVHQIKAGFDYRDLYFDQGARLAGVFYLNFGTIADLSGSSFPVVLPGQSKATDMLFRALSFYGLDTWRLGSHVVLTYGLRWDSNIAPSGRNGTTLATFNNIESPGNLSLAPSGAPLWNTTYSNFAPRAGIAYRMNWMGDLVIRAGGGLFYDLGTGTVANASQSFPNVSASFLLAPPFPVTPGSSLVVPFPTSSPFAPLFLFARDTQLPRSWQWNVAVEKSIGSRQAFTATYVGQAGRRLLYDGANYILAAPIGGQYSVTTNAGSSNYQALQLQFRRSSAHGVQTMLNYTWAHSIDNGSDDSAGGAPLSLIPIQLNRGSSSFDIRQNFTGAFTWDLPSPIKSRSLSTVFGDWGIQGVFQARTGFPVDVTYSNSTLIKFSSVSLRPDLVPGQPIYLSDSKAPGGKRLNRLAFDSATPAAQNRQGTLGRDSIPGFGATQVDLSLVKTIPLAERVKLQFRTDAFNVLNHPNFDNPVSNLSFVSTFGASPQMLSRGLGGQSPLYQVGGPRSLQLSLKLLF
jgi:hypothetical protein